MWDAATTEHFDSWFDSLSETPEGRDAQIEIDASVTVLRNIGPTLSRPMVDTLKGSKHANLKELRIGTAAAVIRIAFAFDPLKTAILLVGGDKVGVSQQRFYKQLVRRADEEYARHLSRIQPAIEAKRAEDAKAKSKRKGR